MTIEVIFKPVESTPEQIEAKERFAETLREMLFARAELNRKELESSSSESVNNK